jgi:hypothetical protein
MANENEYNISMTSGTYYLYIINNSTSSKLLDLMIIPQPHVHSYTKWSYYSSTLHKESCKCGVLGTKTATHVVRSSHVVNGKANCLLCNHLVPYNDGGFGQIIHQIQKVTLNGSYILPNGIIVLVDEDIEAYLNGTLIFYDKNNLPQTQ